MGNTAQPFTSNVYNTDKIKYNIMVDVSKNKIIKLDKDMPTVGDLSTEQKSLYSILNETPKDSEVKKHPFVKRKNEQGQRVPVEYVPISILEAKLDSIFGPLNWKVSEPKYQMLGSSTKKEGQAYMLCTVVISVINTQFDSPVWIERSGTATDFVEHNTFQTIGAKMKTDAFKNAVVSLGDTFGRNLNRNEIENISDSIRASNEASFIESVDTLAELEILFKRLSKADQRKYAKLYTERKTELTNAK